MIKKSVHSNPIRDGQHTYYTSDHTLSTVNCTQNRSPGACTSEDSSKWITNLKKVIPTKIHKVFSRSEKRNPTKQEITNDAVVVTHIRAISKQFHRIGTNSEHVQRSDRSRTALRCVHTEIKVQSETQGKKNWTYSITWGCGKKRIGKTGKQRRTQTQRKNGKNIPV
jgi:hypothetical protein